MHGQTVAAEVPQERLRLYVAPDHARHEPARNATGLRPRLKAALEADGRAAARLSRAATSVTFRVLGAERESVTLLLDRRPPEVAAGSLDAEIVLELTPEQAHDLARGRLVLPTALLEGEVGFRGAIRRYLMVEPILRALLARGEAGR